MVPYGVIEQEEFQTRRVAGVKGRVFPTAAPSFSVCQGHLGNYFYGPCSAYFQLSVADNVVLCYLQS